MPTAPSPFRIAAYNVEWFDELFARDDSLLRVDLPSRRYKVSREEQADAIATVLRAVDADAMLITEAPNTGSRSGRSTVEALSGFTAHYGLRQSRVLHGFASPTHQEIALLYDPVRLSAQHSPKGAPTFDTDHHIDTDGDGVTRRVRFSKPPLEAALRLTDSDAVLRLIGVHMKSKNPRGSSNLQELLENARRNRRIQYGQAAWLRQRIDDHLAHGEHMIVLGDFNDSPGLDPIEAELEGSALEEIVGHGPQSLANPFLMRRGGSAAPSSARFWRNDLKTYVEALLDFVLLSPSLARHARPDWRIWHPFNDPESAGDPAVKHALLTASDHFPVGCTLEL
ncbi:MAG: endonuclease/exonuclease/phosphatase family protein [Pseudomonadota bacterium]